MLKDFEIYKYLFIIFVIFKTTEFVVIKKNFVEKNLFCSRKKKLK